MGENGWRRTGDDDPVPRSLHHRASSAGAARLGWALAFIFIHGEVQARDPTPPGGLAIDHDPPGCVAAEKYARLTACFRPDGAVARGRVYFRPEGTEDWYYVEMTGEPPCLEAVLPRPRKDLGAIEYTISGEDRSLAEVRTAEHTVQVTKTGTCRAGPVAPVVESAAVVIGSTSGTAPVGFLTGDGVNTRLILGVAGAAVAVTTVALLVAGGDEENPPTTTAAASPTATASWRSELAVPGAHGRIVVDGAQAAWTSPGGAAMAASLGPGPHQLEAVIVDGKGRPGSWRFDLSGLGVIPGSIRTVAGEVALVGPDHVTFRFAGEPGERAAFTFRVGRS